MPEIYKKKILIGAMEPLGPTGQHRNPGGLS